MVDHHGVHPSTDLAHEAYGDDRNFRHIKWGAERTIVAQDIDQALDDYALDHARHIVYGTLAANIIWHLIRALRSLGLLRYRRHLIFNSRIKLR